jgi:hypothetical protein
MKKMILVWLICFVLASLIGNISYQAWQKHHQKPSTYWESASWNGVEIQWRPGALTSDKIDLVQHWLELKRAQPDAHDSLWWDSTANSWFKDEE